jgi:hypothetical protein
MMRDSACAAAIERLQVLALTPPPSLGPPGPTADLVRAALPAALECLWRGFAAHEILWGRTAGATTPAAIVLASSDLVALNVDTAGAVVSATLSSNGRSRTLPANRLWLHRHRPDAQHPAGRSRLTLAYRPYRARDQMIQLWGRGSRRNGLPYILVTLPANTDPATQMAIRDELLKLEIDGVATLPDTAVYTVANPTYAATLSMAEPLHFFSAEIRGAILLSDPGDSTVIGRQPAPATSGPVSSSTTDALVALIRAELALSVRLTFGLELVWPSPAGPTPTTP